MRSLALIALLLAGCGAGAGVNRTATLRPSCWQTQAWDGARCRARAPAGRTLSQGTAALAAFRVEEALGLLQRALAHAPHPHAEHAAIYEQLGIAYAYQGREKEALAAFDMLLALDPGHLLSYNLSPKVTFTFESARVQASRRPPPELQVQWPNGLRVSRPLPIDLEVVADPRRLLDRATIYVRRRGEPRFSAVDLALSPPGQRRRVTLPPVESARAEVVQVYVAALDRRGNEVLRWGDPTRPREIALRYDPPPPWWRRWWVWAAAGGAIAAGSAVVFFATRPLPGTIGGEASME
ncbi:MAG TPA: tetratricopeptide repeat protein [Kofleriaceae bacterium]|nr:tetratricopeptide repeat protein [Kofleriaceae bacterium]